MLKYLQKQNKIYSYVIVFFLGFGAYHLVNIPKDRQCESLFLEVKKFLIVAEAEDYIKGKKYTKEELMFHLKRMRSTGIGGEESIKKIDILIGELNEH